MTNTEPWSQENIMTDKDCEIKIYIVDNMIEYRKQMYNKQKAIDLIFPELLGICADNEISNHVIALQN